MSRKRARVHVGGPQVDRELHDLVAAEIVPGTGVEADTVWAALADIVASPGPRNRALLAHRDALQARLDDWHRCRRGQAHDAGAYRAFLHDIGYLGDGAEPSRTATPSRRRTGAGAR